jgi:small neutral amino acid transporter SnatA (MarC family)
MYGPAVRCKRLSSSWRWAVALALVLAITYGLLQLAGPITRIIGVSGANVIERVMGMILASYAIVYHALEP